MPISQTGEEQIGDKTRAARKVRTILLNSRKLNLGLICHASSFLLYFLLFLLYCYFSLFLSFCECIWFSVGWIHCCWTQRIRRPDCLLWQRYLFIDRSTCELQALSMSKHFQSNIFCKRSEVERNQMPIKNRNIYTIEWITAGKQDKVQLHRRT